MKFALVITSILLVIAGLSVGQWGVLAIRNRKATLTQFRSDPSKLEGVKRFWWIWTSMTFASGISLIAASVLLWSKVGLGIALAIWPISLMLFLAVGSKFKANSNP